MRINLLDDKNKPTKRKIRGPVKKLLNKHKNLIYGTTLGVKGLCLIVGSTYVAHHDQPVAATIGYGAATAFTLAAGYVLGKYAEKKESEKRKIRRSNYSPLTREENSLNSYTFKPLQKRISTFRR